MYVYARRRMLFMRDKEQLAAWNARDVYIRAACWIELLLSIPVFT